MSLFQFIQPALDTTHLADEGAQITLGDLHGNAIKLLYMLVRHGVITDISDVDYDELVSIYIKNVDDVTKEDLQKFAAIIDSVKYHPIALIRLLGDEFSDRGSNDYFTLQLLKKLREQKVTMEIILSNHACEFIEAYETKLKFFPSILEPQFASSMINMQILIVKKILTREEVFSAIKEAYKPNLKAVSYSLSEDNKAITLFTHAPVDIRAIKALATKLLVEFEDYSPVALAKTIDAINHEYHLHVMNNTVHTLYDKNMMEEGYEVKTFSPLYNPIEYLTWNRNLKHLDLTELYKGYHVFYAHGHDSTLTENTNVYNLDNTLGKSVNNYLGPYTALYSHEKQLALINKFKIGQASLPSSQPFRETEKSKLLI